MPSTPPISRIALVAPEAWPASSGRTAPKTDVGDGREERGGADAGEHQRRRELTVDGVGSRDRCHPAERDRVEQGPEGPPSGAFVGAARFGQFRGRPQLLDVYASAKDPATAARLWEFTEHALGRPLPA
jgi:hypothetical protein